MTNKTGMQEVITVHRVNNGRTFPDNMHVTDLNTGVPLDDGIEECEYIRADLAYGDAKEPFADGQYRWVRIREGDDWTVVEIIIGRFSGEAMFFMCGNEVEEDVEGCHEWGPVINPPKDI